VEERKNQHINDLVKNHKKAFNQMKLYYNEITRGNLQLISNLQKQTEELKTRASNNKRMLLEYAQENQNLSKPLAKVSAEIADLQGQLKERTKDQMALRNAVARLNAVRKKSTNLRESQAQLEEDYKTVEKERDELYNTFEETIKRVHQQSEFHNQALEQRLRAAEATVEKAAAQIEEIIRAANLDGAEMSRVMMSINQMLSAKDEALRDVTFLVAKLKKNFNDALATYSAKFKELGISQSEIDSMGFSIEELLPGTSFAPSGMLAK
jgi:chromosome segregation ATPase